MVLSNNNTQYLKYICICKIHIKYIFLNSILYLPITTHLKVSIKYVWIKKIVHKSYRIQMLYYTLINQIQTRQLIVFYNYYRFNELNHLVNTEKINSTNKKVTNTWIITCVFIILSIRSFSRLWNWCIFSLKLYTFEISHDKRNQRK